MTEPDYYHVKIEAMYHRAPGEDPISRETRVSERVSTLDEARSVIDERIPVSLDSGDPMHYDHGSKPQGGRDDEYNVGRVYHYWMNQPRSKDLWVDAWVSVEAVTQERVPYTDIVPEADTEFEGGHVESV